MHLVEANLKGHDSHGVGMIPSYVKNTAAGLLHPNQHAKLISETGPIAVFDGQMGYGQVIAREATEWAIAKAKSIGVGIFALRNTHHVARVGTYGELAAAAGMVSIHFVNVVLAPGRVAPFGGMGGTFRHRSDLHHLPRRERQASGGARLRHQPRAAGKLRVAMNEGKEFPPGYLIDAEGLDATRQPCSIARTARCCLSASIKARASPSLSS